MSRLHYEFDGWLGDPIVESFPSFIVTEAARGAIVAADLTGAVWDRADVSTSEQFRELHPDRTSPHFRWMRVTGTPGLDDFGIGRDHRLVASQRALKLLQRHGMQHAEIEDYGSG